MANKIVTFCGHKYETQVIAGWTLFEVSELKSSLYKKYGDEQDEDTWFLSRISVLDRKVFFPFIDVICQPIGDAPILSSVLRSPAFTHEDMKGLTEIIQSFSASVTGNSDKQPVTRKTSNAKGRTKKKAPTS
jgi:hypothetical protein